MVYNFLPYNLKRPVNIIEPPPSPKKKQTKNKKEKKYLIDKFLFTSNSNYIIIATSNIEN